MIHIYTGNGKGKTTAALGLIIRALGNGKRVCLIQFMKKNFVYGEIKFLEKQKNIDIFQFGTDQLIDPNNPDELADKMYKVLTNKKIKNKLIKKGLARVKQFSWEKCAKETINVYKKLENGP